METPWADDAGQTAAGPRRRNDSDTQGKLDVTTIIT